MYFSKGLSAVHLNISFRYTRTRELSELIRLKTDNYIYWVTWADLYFDERMISIRNYIYYCHKVKHIPFDNTP